MPRRNLDRTCTRKKTLDDKSDVIKGKRSKAKEAAKGKIVKKTSKPKDVKNDGISIATDIEELLWIWFLSTIDLEQITDNTLMSKAKEFIQQLGYNSFKVTQPWLKSFQSKHEIVADGKGGLNILSNIKTAASLTPVDNAKPILSTKTELSEKLNERQRDTTDPRFFTEEFFSETLSDIGSDNDAAFNETSSDSDDFRHVDVNAKTVDKPMKLPQLSFGIHTLKDVVDLFVADDFFEFITVETNKYHALYSEKCEIARSDEWIELTVSELKRWFALGLLMIGTRKWSISDYWSSPIFPNTMSYDRYRQIYSFVHFSNSDCAQRDRPHKVQRVVDYFRKKFKSAYKPEDDIVSSYELVSWEQKSSKIKRGVLVEIHKESNTDYVTDFRIHTNIKSADGGFVIKKAIDDCRKRMHKYFVYNESKKWSTKVVLYLFYCALHNAYCTYKSFDADLGKKKEFTFATFLNNVARLWLDYKHDVKQCS